MYTYSAFGLRNRYKLLVAAFLSQQSNKTLGPQNPSPWVPRQAFIFMYTYIHGEAIGYHIVLLLTTAFT